MDMCPIRPETHETDRPLRMQFPKPKGGLMMASFPLKSQFAYNDLAIGQF